MVREMKENYYVCGFCNRRYSDKEEAEKCERRDEENKRIEFTTKFEVKDYHIKLLQRMRVNWQDEEFGAPCIDPKRPYGNSDVIEDMVEILGIKKTKERVDEYDKNEVEMYESEQEYLEEYEWSDEIVENLIKVHKEMKIVLQIFLSTLSIEKGVYEKTNRYGDDWKKVS